MLEAMKGAGMIRQINASCSRAFYLFQERKGIMSKRKDLSELFKSYKQQYDIMQAKIREVRNSTL